MMVKRILNQEEPFRVLIGVALFVGSLLTYGLVLLFSSRGKCEAFANEDGSVGGILATVQRVSSVLLQPSTWTDRIEMYTMSPVDLARRYLKSQAKEEDGETE
jgi:hypothetical protein